MTENQCCGKCDFFLKNSSADKGLKINPKNKDQGQCRCDRPQVILTMQQSQKAGMADGKLIMAGTEIVSMLQSVFPMMNAKDPGCGRYQPIVRSTNGD